MCPEEGIASIEAWGRFVIRSTSLVHETEGPPLLQRLEQEIGHTFSDPAILYQALTHRSFLDEQSRKGLRHNETMEFLGDAILGFFISRELVNLFPEAKVGSLAKAKSHLVSTTHLFHLAGLLGLGDYLLLSPCEEKMSGRGKKSLVADAFEALIAALYLDGGMEAAERFLMRQFHPALEELDIERAGHTDYKSTLLEAICLLKWPEPRFMVLKETGPDHQKTFLITLEIPGVASFQATGRSKKEGQQIACSLALEVLPELKKSGLLTGK